VKIFSGRNEEGFREEIFSRRNEVSLREKTRRAKCYNEVTGIFDVRGMEPSEDQEQTDGLS
jgi:hypothetical protein